MGRGKETLIKSKFKIFYKNYRNVSLQNRHEMAILHAEMRAKTMFFASPIFHGCE